MTARVRVRGGSHLRRGRAVRRASARISFVRVGAVAVLLAVSGATWRVVDVEAFPLRQVAIDGAVLTDRAAVEQALIGSAAGGAFGYDSRAAAARVAALPTVLHAAVHVALPDTVVASIDERVPVLTWSVGKDTGGFLADSGGLLFTHADTPPPTLVHIADRRSATAGMAVGDTLAPVDLRAALALASVTPAMLGTGATRLSIAITDAEGFVMTTDPPGWTAVFGPYGEVTRGTDIVSLQVQCLASLLAASPETGVGRVVLSPEGQTCGTFAPPKAP
jgi:cell division protein FtsQ